MDKRDHHCEDCDADISRRQKIVPEATRCVKCQEEHGDVPKYLGIRTPIKGATKHLDGCDKHIIRDPKIIKKRGTLYKHQRYPQ